MKKFLSVLLGVLVLSSMFACGNNVGSKSAANNAANLTEVNGVTIPKFSVTINDKVVTNEDLAEFPIYKAVATSVNSSGTESTVNYIGFKFVDALEKAGLSGEKQYIEAIADDGYSVKYEKRDINSMLIAISKDGSQFKKNPWFCPCDSNITGEYLQGLTNILVNDSDEKPNVAGKSAKADSNESKELSKPDKQDKTDKVQFKDFSLKIGDKTVTNKDLEGLSIYKISCDALNSKDAVISSTYTGYVLTDVLNKLNITGFNKITAIALDGYNAELTKEQIGSEYTLIAIEKDKETGKDGSFWLAPCEEDKTKKYISEVVELKVE